MIVWSRDRAGSCIGGRVFTCGGSDCGKLGMGDEAQRFLPAQARPPQYAHARGPAARLAPARA